MIVFSPDDRSTDSDANTSSGDHGTSNNSLDYDLWKVHPPRSVVVSTGDPYVKAPGDLSKCVVRFQASGDAIMVGESNNNDNN